MAFDFSSKKEKKEKKRKAARQTSGVSEITYRSRKQPMAKPRFGESKRGLTLAGALRWKRDSSRAGR